jgi:hypothetical protein
MNLLRFCFSPLSRSDPPVFEFPLLPFRGCTRNGRNRWRVECLPRGSSTHPVVCELWSVTTVLYVPFLTFLKERRIRFVQVEPRRKVLVRLMRRSKTCLHLLGGRVLAKRLTFYRKPNMLNGKTSKQTSHKNSNTLIFIRLYSTRPGCDNGRYCVVWLPVVPRSRRSGQGFALETRRLQHYPTILTMSFSPPIQDSETILSTYNPESTYRSHTGYSESRK